MRCLAAVAFLLASAQSEVASTPEDRSQACRRAADTRSAAEIPAVGVLLLKDPVAKVREECLKALRRIGTPAAVPFVRAAALGDADKYVRAVAVSALEDLDAVEGGTTAAKVLANDREPLVRRRALWAVEHRRWVAAQTAVIELLKTERVFELRKAALKALMEIGTEEGYRVIYSVLLHDESADLRREAAEVVERRPLQSSLGPLCQALKDSDGRVAGNAAQGLAALRFRRGARCLREAARELRDDKLAAEMTRLAGRLED